jgi:hypothetical protein
MQPVITLFKTEFSEHSQLFQQLNIHSDEVKECEFFYTYSPPPNRLTEVLNVLRKNKVAHGVHFETPKFTARRPQRHVVAYSESELLSI